jgi:hypothetical protein
MRAAVRGLGARPWSVLFALTTLLAAACTGGDGVETRSVATAAPEPSVADDSTDEAVPETSSATTTAGTDGDASTEQTGSTESTESTESNEPVEGSADWTVLVYVMGDNDLEPFAVQDLLEMSEVGTGDRVNIVALVDRHPDYPLEGDPLGDFSDTRLLRIESGDLIDTADPGELNVGDPETLAAFIEGGITEYPAERYAVVLWNHGAGWPGMGPDETDGNDILDLADIDAGFRAGLGAVGLDHVDLVGFDACLMASYEVASVMAEHADLMIASSELEPGHGWDYGSLSALEADPATTPEELGRHVIDGFAAQAAEAGTDEEITLSLVDLAAMDALQAALGALADPMIADPTAAAPLLAKAQAGALKFAANPDPSIDSYHVDLGQLAVLLGESDPALAEPAAAVGAVLDQMVLASTSGPATVGATGLSIYFPPFADVFRQGYLNLEGVEVWPDLLTSFYMAGEAIPVDDRVAFLPTEGTVAGEGDYFFDEDGLNLFGFFDPALESTVVEAEISYGVLDESDGSIIFIGEEPAEVSTDGSGIAAAIYDLTALTITDGEDTDYAYLDVNIDRDLEIATIDVPLWYVAPEDIERDVPPEDVVLSLVLDLDFNILSEVYYVVNTDGTVGELTADPDGLIFPVVLNEYPDGTSEWLTLSERGLYASLPDLQYDFEPLEAGTGLYAELVLRDYGGNTASVSMFDVIPD